MVYSPLQQSRIPALPTSIASAGEQNSLHLISLTELPCLTGTAGEMLHVAEPFLERNLHPTVIVRGFHRALEDAVAIVDTMAFPVDTDDRGQMLKILNSCIGTKYTARFGTLLAVSHSPPCRCVIWGCYC